MKRQLTIALGLLIGLAATGVAQVRAGEAAMNLNGTISGGYTADYSNYTGSDHSFTAGGDASLSGYYYNPNFVSFSVQPFYNQSRANSTYQSVSAASGFSANANIFSGSDFPGSIAFSKVYNGTGGYTIPGAGQLVTHGDSSLLSINWGVRRDGYPSLGFGFIDSGGSSSIFGFNDREESHTRAFTATATYQLWGFSLNGGFQHTGSNSMFPENIGSSGVHVTDSGANSYSVGIGHKLPLHGSFSATGNRTDVSTNAEALQYDTKVDSVSSALTFAPFKNFSAGGSATLIDNLDGYLYTSLIGSGIYLPQDLRQTTSSSSLSISSYANYDIPVLHVHLRGFEERQQQHYLGASFVSNSINGNADYSNHFLGGQLTTDIGVTHSSVNISGRTSNGLNGSASFMRSIGAWDAKTAFSYSQNTQTLLAAYTSSGYSYSGSLGRHFGRNYWSINGSGSRSLLTDQPGSENSSQSYSMSLNFRKIGVSGNYSKSNGNALLSSTGLIATPVPVPVINPAAIVVFNGTSYGFGIGSSPIRGLTVSASFAKALSSTISSANWSKNNNDNVNVLVIYQVRKLNFTAGYVRLNQGFSPSLAPATMLGSYYFGISRWFNIF